MYKLHAYKVTFIKFSYIYIMTVAEIENYTGCEDDDHDMKICKLQIIMTGNEMSTALLLLEL